MNIVIDIEEKVNSEIHAGHICRDDIQNIIDKFNLSRSDLFKLYVTDDFTNAHKLLNSGAFVVPVLNDHNSSLDFSEFKYLITDPQDVDDDFYYKIWQRYVGLPWHIMETDRCILREMTVLDISELYLLYDSPDITQFTEPLFPDYEDELEYTNNYIHNVYEYFGFGTWIVQRKSDKKIIGRAGFNYRPGYDYPELGYVFGTKYQGQGYATEICKAICNYGFKELEFNFILAFSSPDNIPSIKLLNKLGFVHDSNIIEPDDAKVLGFEMKPYVLAK